MVTTKGESKGESSTITWANQDKWVMGILGTVLTSAIIFLCATVYSDHMTTARVSDAIVQIKDDIKGLRDEFRDFSRSSYSSDEAKKDQSILLEMINEANKRAGESATRIQNLSDRITRIEAQPTGK